LQKDKIQQFVSTRMTLSLIGFSGSEILLNTKVEICESVRQKKPNAKEV